MNAYLINLWDRLRTSFWFVPAVMGIVAVAASFALPVVDERVDDRYLTWIDTTTLAARSTLSAIAGAMMTVTGTVFSITVVTLSLTSQQFGPRLLRTFMDDFITQFSMGAFLSTGLYCLMILRIVEEHEEIGPPLISVAVAVLLTLFSMSVLIYYIHHVALAIQAPHVIVAVARDLDHSIDRLFPQHIGQPADDDELDETRAAEQQRQLGEVFHMACCDREGYIQAIDAVGLMHLATSRDLVIQLRKRPGHFVSREGPLAEVWNVSDNELGDVERQLNECVIVGRRRTPRQDVECAIGELVEVAVRALSAGINDPHTAISCIDRLGAAMGRLAERRPPRPLRCDDDGRLRVIAPNFTFPDVLDAAFNQIRQYGGGSPAVMIRLLEILANVMQRAIRAEDRSAILRHADMTLRAIEANITEEEDLKVVRERYGRVAASVRRSRKSSSASQ
ncbi:MAG: DUF2254 domain-containing protein [Pirellulaceae bacterium]